MVVLYDFVVQIKNAVFVLVKVLTVGAGNFVCVAAAVADFGVTRWFIGTTFFCYLMVGF